MEKIEVKINGAQLRELAKHSAKVVSAMARMVDYSLNIIEGNPDIDPLQSLGFLVQSSEDELKLVRSIVSGICSDIQAQLDSGDNN